jgi:hypothetical protein
MIINFKYTLSPQQCPDHYLVLKKYKKRPPGIVREALGLMRMTGLEPAQAEAHYPLKVACLPIPPHPLIFYLFAAFLGGTIGIAPCGNAFI